MDYINLFRRFLNISNLLHLTFLGRNSPLTDFQYLCTFFRQKLTAVEKKRLNDLRKYFVTNIHQRILSELPGTETRDFLITDCTRIRLSHRGRFATTECYLSFLATIRDWQQSQLLPFSQLKLLRELANPVRDLCFEGSPVHSDKF